MVDETVPEVPEKKFNQSNFFDIVREELFGGGLSQTQVEGLQIIGAACAKAELHPLVEQTAYVMATVFHEKAQTMQPIEEYGGSSTRYAPWYGRGYVQLTWEDNYAKQEAKMGDMPEGTFFMDDWKVHENWDRAMIPDVSAFICVNGMKDGDFTGVGLSKYIKEGSCDYWNARRIVNGTDKAELIAGYANIFEDALAAGFEGMEIPMPPPPPVEGEAIQLSIVRVQVGESINEVHPDVLTAQALLAGHDYDAGELDGIAGPKFTAAVKEFQKDMGIQVTGILDAASWDDLENWIEIGV